ncbi:MAG: hypothetical protein Hals2KO_15290 [Halioglobus sp.]
MSTVYLAEQLNFERPVALKILTANRAETEQFGQRFLREAKIAASLSHPNIVTVHDTGTIDGSYFLAMEYLPGGDLRTRIQSGVPLLEALDIVTAMADAVDYACEQGVVHRDLKPANLMFRQDGTLAIVDFGIARDITSDTEVTRVGTILGTPRYMSPEQSLGQPVDIRSDLYSIGIVFYEMLSGDVPFKASSAAGVGAQHITSEVPPLPSETSLFQGIVDKTLAKQPDERYQSGDELIDDIERLREEMPADLATTILLSKPQADSNYSLGSSASNIRSKRRRTRSRNSRIRESGGPRFAYLSTALIALLVSAAVGGGFYWLSQKGLDSPIFDETPDPVVVPRQIESEPASIALADMDIERISKDSEKLIALANQTLEKAELALDERRLKTASGYLDIVSSLGVESDDVVLRLKVASLERDRLAELEMETEALAKNFDKLMRDGRLYYPVDNSAFTVIETIQEAFPDFPELGAMRDRLHATARSAIRKELANGRVSAAQTLLAQMKGKAPDSLYQSLSAETKRLKSKTDTREMELADLRKKIREMEALSAPVAAQRGELLDAYEQLLRSQPKDKAARQGLVRALDNELALAEKALVADDLSAASEALENLRTKGRESERSETLRRQLVQVSNSRRIAEQQLSSVLGILNNLGELDSRKSTAYHAAQAANLISAYRTLRSAQKQYPKLPDAQSVMRRLDEAYTQRFNAFANPESQELAMVYHKALSEAKLELSNVDSLIIRFDEKIEGLKKSRRRSYTTF